MLPITAKTYTTHDTYQHKILLQSKSTFISSLVLFCLIQQISALSAPGNSNLNSRLRINQANQAQQQYIPPTDSPLNHLQIQTEYDAHGNSKSYTWLDQATNDMMDASRVPMGQLTIDEVDSISGLMANWAKRKSAHSALQVEILLKRVVDDHNAGNASVNVTTRMYTMAIDAWAKTGGKQAAERASEIHRGMVEVYRETGDVNIKPSTISYNAVINAWSKSGDAEAAMRAEEILQEMLDEWRSTRKIDVQNDAVPINLKASGAESLSKEINDDDDADNDSINKEDLDDVIERDGSIVKPDVVSFTSVIDTWAKSGKKNGAAKAMNLLKQMEQLYMEEGELGMKPNVYTYSACINAFAKSSDSESPKRAEALLGDMQRAYEAGDMDVKPNVVNYNSVINAWGRCTNDGSAERATEILSTMEDEGVEPDALSYSLVVSAWAHCQNSNATKKAEGVLAKMEEWATEKNRAIDEAFDNGLSNHASANGQFNRDADTPSSLPAIRVHLDVECYNTVLIALSRRRELDASQRALEILYRMIYLADNGFETVRPNAKSWNSVLNTLSRASYKDSTQRAEQLLREMYDAGIHPDVFSYAALLHAYQKNASPYAAERADDIVRQMEQLYFDGKLNSPPDVYHYTIVCACWARSGESIAAQRCFEIIQHMELRAEQGFLNCNPNVRTYNAVIDAYARGHHVDEAENLLDDMIGRYRLGDQHVKPDGFTFNAVINAWTRSKRRDCGARAEMILKRLLEFHESGNPDVKPDSRSFSHIIDYYSRSREPDAGKKAEWLLLGMVKMYGKGYKDVLPTIFTFTAVISTYAKSKCEDAGINGERVLHMLNDFQKENGITSLVPNTFVINTVLHAWSKSGHPQAGERTSAILTNMEKEYNSGNFLQQPNTRSYGLVLAAWAKCACSDKSKKAQEILRRMEIESENNEHVTMNVHCYNAVMNAAAFTEGALEYRTEAFNIATQTLDELVSSKDVDPISSSFGTYIKGCGKLSLPRRYVEPAIGKAFNGCRELGLVNDFVLTQVHYSTCTAQYQSLLGELAKKKKLNERITMAEIPQSWTKNVSKPFFGEKGEWWRNE